jgi:hypothetical protein
VFPQPASNPFFCIPDVAQGSFFLQLIQRLGYRFKAKTSKQKFPFQPLPGVLGTGKKM